MQFLSSLIFACSVNIDAFIVAMSYGIKKTKIRFSQNMVISLIAFLSTLISIGGGQCILKIVNPVWAQYVGAVTLFTLGLFYVEKGLHPSDEPSENTVPLFTFRETIALAAVLSLNNMGIGVGAGISGVSAPVSSLFAFLVSLLFLFLGNRLGNSSLFHFSTRYADCICGILLIILAIYSYASLVFPF